MTKVLALAAMVFMLTGGSAAAELSADIAAPYLRIQTTLAADSIDGVADAANAIVKAAGALGDDGASIVAAARAVALADDLTKARATFGLLSDALIAHADEAGLGELKVAFCPMARKSWIQADGEIANPYYGSAMLTCGSFK
jgi:hypothetical protein